MPSLNATKCLLIFIIFSFLIPFVSAQEEKNVYIVDIKQNGSATIITERKIFFATQEDKKTFEKYDAEQIKKEYEKEWTTLVNSSEAYTGRSMSAQNFDVFISTNPIGNFGLIKFQFEWRGFAKMEDGRIIAGDVFIGGLFLFKDDTLTVNFPEGYNVEDALPKPDSTEKRQIVWRGPKDFASGEPKVIIRQEVSYPWTYALLPIIAVAVFCIFILRRKKVAQKIEFEKKDEDRIIELLKSGGGNMYQSEIVTKTGFSKSKTSALLDSMKKRGMIQKIKKGRENLIRRLV